MLLKITQSYLKLLEVFFMLIDFTLNYMKLLEVTQTYLTLCEIT